MKTERQDLLQKYRIALEEYLAGSGESGLQKAYELGRSALNRGLGVLETAAVEYEALESYFDKQQAERSAMIVQSASNFLLEGLSPFEMTHRGFSEENIALRLLNQRLIGQIEEQAKRIGQTLHDEAGQLLTAVHIALAGLEQDVNDHGYQKIREIEDLLRMVEQQLRSLSHELRPVILDDLGLMPALEFLARGVSSRTGIPIAISGPRTERLPVEVETALYRIAQEALTNISKHAKATNATVLVKCSEKMALCSIRDDGIGFDFARVGRKGLGLHGIKERLASLGGTLQVDSAAGKGTELRAIIPLAQMTQQADSATT